MKLITYISLILALFNCHDIYAQTEPKMVIQARVVDGKVLLNWYPNDVTVWRNSLESGYTISRENLSGTNAGFAPQRIVTRNQEWFKANVRSEDGVLYPIGEILYNPDFSIPGSDNADGWSVKYNYIVYESTLDNKVASAVGLGFVDSTIIKGGKYRYTITSTQSNIAQSITILVDDGNQIQEPEKFYKEFSFPGGNSLSEMNELSKPFVLKSIVGKARPMLDSVVLRWAPTTPEIWRQAMKDGYDIYKLDTTGQPIKLTTVFPWHESRFKSIDVNDSLSLLAASFIQDKGLPRKMENENFYEKASMESNYLGFALMMADRSATAANILGLRYVDHDVKRGEVYNYQIRSKNLNSNLPPNDIRVENNYEPLFAPEGFSILKKEKVVTLQWLANSAMSKYGSYIVERAIAGDSVFHVITNPPLVFVKEPSVTQTYYQFIDSLPNVQKVYRYRVKGSNAFGEWSEYAYSLGYALDRTPPVPVEIKRGDYQEDSIRLRISWKLPVPHSDTKYHQVLLADNPDYNYGAVSGELSPKDTVFYFSVKNMDTDRPFYFKVMSMDSSGNQAMSILRYVSVPDLEKPFSPENFKVSIDTTGVIQASWSPSKSKDVTGYYVYYSNDDGTDLTVLNDYLHKDTTYSWTIPLNTLTKNIYIGVKAEDDNYNRSPISEIVTLRRPDKIAPPKPFLSRAFLDTGYRVYLSWKKSSAKDVEKYFIYRKIKKDTASKWMILDSLSNTELEYYDDKFPDDCQMEYALKAIDDFHNISELSNTIPVNIPFPADKYAIDLKEVGVSGNMMIKMNWSLLNPKDPGLSTPYSYELFRSVGNDELTFYKTLEKSENNFSEKVDAKNVLYNYAIRVKFNNNKAGALSEVKSILIK